MFVLLLKIHSLVSIKEEIKNLLSDVNLGEKQEKPVDDKVYLKSYSFHISPKCR